METQTQAISDQRRFFQSGRTQSYGFRRDALVQLRTAIRNHESEILQALEADLGKSPFDVHTSEIGLVYQEIRHALRHLRKWMRPRRVPTSLSNMPARSSIEHVPLGRVLIVAPWNFPFQLQFVPLVSAIAGGNVAVLKPSEISEHTARVIERVVAAAFPPEHVAVVQGVGAEVVPELIGSGDLDHLFFTGSVAAGRSVAVRAAQHDIPVTLELGGKSPAVVHRDAALPESARRIVYGKTMNSGQVCIAPDYALVHRDVVDDFIAHAVAALNEFYPDGALASSDYGRMINQRHFDRVLGYLADGTIVHGGASDAGRRRIEPTIMTRVSEESGLLHEEIFGPILPVLTYSTEEELLTELRKRPNPLAFYVFSADRSFVKRVTSSVPFGGGCVNHTILHISSQHLPFGGVRTSGQGRYHGRFGFDTMTHPRAMVTASTRFELPVRYPPYTEKQVAMVRRMLR